MALDVLPLDCDSRFGHGLLLECRAAWQAPRTLPWPKRIHGNLSWDGGEIDDHEDAVLTLTAGEEAEVCSALEYFHSLELYGSEVSMDTFPLPTLRSKLLRLANGIHDGKGFAAIRGLDPSKFSPEDNMAIFLGISSYIGGQRGRQDEDGNMLAHICDSKVSNICQEDRPIRYSTRASTFHTDTFCDILALQTRRRAAEGGRNIIASSWTVYNKIAARRPELIQLLAAPIWPFDSRGRFFKSGTRPLLFLHDGRIILNFSREPLLGLDGVSRPPGLAHLTQEQREALDYIEQVAQESQLVLDSGPGDLLFVNNHAMLHSREGFRDAPGKSRYLVRMWLRNPELAWQLPEALQDGNERIYGGSKRNERWNIANVAKTKFRLSERLLS